jgi:hypothetical protein
MLRDSKVSEHLDTKSIVGPTPSPRHATVILAKWRPSGRSTNRRTAERISLIVLRSRDPVSLGEVEGVFHISVSLPGLRENNARSLRKGRSR